MLTTAQEELVLDTLYFHYGICDAYFHSGRLFVINREDLAGVEKLLETLNFSFLYQCTQDDIGYYA